MICFIALLIVTPHMSQNARQAQFLVELNLKGNVLILIAPQGASMLQCSANPRASNQTSHYICRTTTNPLYGVGDPLGIIWYLGKSVFINCQQYASD